jgi:hypothetical protein
LTYAQIAQDLSVRETIGLDPGASQSDSAKCLISLTFISCPLHGHFVGRLDFQGLEAHQAKFSTKLSTGILDEPRTL